MTTMDTDSESQDSDDGRRFRFEATRKDATALRIGGSARHKHEHRQEDEHRDHRERREASYAKHEIRRDHHRSSKDRDGGAVKDHRHAAKYPRYSHDSRSSRHEDGKGQREGRNTDSSLVSKQKTRDSKRHRHRDRSEHRKHRSQERSVDRAQEGGGGGGGGGGSSVEKHRTKCHERYKHRSREREYQSDKPKPSEYERRSREEKERRESYKRISTKENEHRKEYLSVKDTEEKERRGESEPLRTASNKIGKHETENGQQQTCTELDLSEFDVLSETDENFSDRSEARERGSPIRRPVRKSRKRERGDEHHVGGSLKEQRDGTSNSEEARSRTDRQKVNTGRIDDRVSRSTSGSNASTVSDLVLNHSSPVTSASKRERVNEHRERTIREPRKQSVDLIDATQGTDEVPVEEASSPGAADLCYRHASVFGEVLSFDDTSESVYGPALPPQLSTKSNISDESTDNDQNTENALIGPCLPETEKLRVSTDQEDASSARLADTVTQEDQPATVEHDPVSVPTFGPALPPHLAQQRNPSTRERLIGPMLPSSFECKINDHDDGDGDGDDGPDGERIDSEEEGAIGPLPVDHPALKTNHVYEQLEQRARRIMDERMEEDQSALSHREQWMTELPPAQANNLGLSSRKFRVRPGPDMSDRSCWTDTPAQKAEKQRKREEERSSHRHRGESDDREHEKRTAVLEESEGGKKSGKKRDKSLLEMHQSKLRKKKKKEEKDAKETGASTRRPFDRDIDLKANQFDQVQKKAIFMKAQLLDERFSRGQI